MSNRAFFIGGPGTLSTSAIQDLLVRGYEVAVFSRPTHFDELPSGVRTYPGERHQPNALKNAFDDFLPDVVLDFICFTPQEAEQTRESVTGKGSPVHFCQHSGCLWLSLSDLPFCENDPWHAETQSQYAADKRQCEEIFKSPGPASLPLTIARPAYSFGPRFILSFTSRDYGVHMLRRLRDGRPILIPGDGTTLMHVSSALNTGRMIAALVDAPQAVGNDYTCGHPNFTTQPGMWTYSPDPRRSTKPGQCAHKNNCLPFRPGSANLPASRSDWFQCGFLHRSFHEGFSGVSLGGHT